MRKRLGKRYGIIVSLFFLASLMFEMRTWRTKMANAGKWTCFLCACSFTSSLFSFNRHSDAMPYIHG